VNAGMALGVSRDQKENVRGISRHRVVVTTDRSNPGAARLFRTVPHAVRVHDAYPARSPGG
jgi:hypothetical protein